jgi:hypothetical protein
MAKNLKTQLTELSELHESGLLTDADYQKQKDALLAASVATPPAPPQGLDSTPQPPSVYGIAIVVVSALSFVCGGFFFSLPALIMSRIGQSKINAWEMASGSKHPEAGMVKAGFWISLINLVFFTLLLCFYFVIFVVAILSEL